VVPQQLPAQLPCRPAHNCRQRDSTAQLDCRRHQLLCTKLEGRCEPLCPVGARQLADGKGIVDNYQFYFASKKLAAEHPEAVKAVIEELRSVDAWVKADPKAAAAQLSVSTGVPAPILELALDRQGYGIVPISDDVVKAQQNIADTFLALGLLPKPITVSEAVWKVGS
jgi:sulfonate transport system substrate-binding protein